MFELSAKNCVCDVIEEFLCINTTTFMPLPNTMGTESGGTGDASPQSRNQRETSPQK